LLRIAYRLDGENGTAQYRAKPVELNANAAAAKLVRARYPDQVGELLASDRFAPLATQRELIRDDELARATTLYVAERAASIDVAKVLCSRKSPKAIVDAAYPGAYDWWPEEPDAGPAA
jgi:hypothetical protein